MFCSTRAAQVSHAMNIAKVSIELRTSASKRSIRFSREADLETSLSRKDMEPSRQQQLSDSVRVLPQGSRDSDSDVEPTVWCPSAFIAQSMSPCAVLSPSQDSTSPALSVADGLSSDVKDVSADGLSEDVKDASADDCSRSWPGGATVALRFLAESDDSLVVRSTAAIERCK